MYPSSLSSSPSSLSLSLSFFLSSFLFSHLAFCLCLLCLSFSPGLSSQTSTVSELFYSLFLSCFLIDFISLCLTFSFLSISLSLNLSLAARESAQLTHLSWNRQGCLQSSSQLIIGWLLFFLLLSKMCFSIFLPLSLSSYLLLSLSHSTFKLFFASWLISYPPIF